MVSFFFLTSTATTAIYTLSLHDALPIYLRDRHHPLLERVAAPRYEALQCGHQVRRDQHRVDRLHLVTDRKSTRLNSSHQIISYAVFCLKKKRVDATFPGVLCGVDGVVAR